MWDQAGPARGLWRILDGKVESGLISDLKLWGGSPSLCWLRTASVGPYCNNTELCTDAYGIYGDPANVVASTVTESDDAALYFMGDIVIVWGPPTEPRWGIVCKTCTRVRGTRLDSLIVVVKRGRLCCLHGSRVSCCQVISLARWLLIQISIKPSDMGEACSLCPNVEVLYHHVHWDLWLCLIMTTWLLKMMILKIVDWFTRLFSIGCQSIIIANQLNLVSNLLKMISSRCY
jgi:hypothetical protein